MEDAEISLLEIIHDVKSIVLIKENYSLMPYIYSTWKIKIIPSGSIC